MPVPVIEWSEIFETGVASVDAQHRRLVELANGLGGAILQGDRAGCDRFCAELARYAREHFGDEEACMDAAGVPPETVARHRAGHAAFGSDLERLRAAAPPGPARLEAVHRFALSWLVHHILVEHETLLGHPPGAAPPAPEGASTTLLDAIHTLHAALSGLNRDLEGQVAQRTRELADANLRLAAEKQALEAALAELRDTRARLLHGEKMAMAGQFAAGVAHEINNPAGFVRSNLAMLRDYANDLLEIVDAYREAEPLLATAPGTLSALRALCADRDLAFIRQDVPKLLAESDHGLQRIGHIAGRLLDCARPGRQGRVAVDLHETLDGTLAMVAHILREKAEVRREYGVLPAVVCDPSEIGQVFTNVLVNAAQAIEAHGLVTLRTGTGARGIWVEIADDGAGIAAGDIGHIFEPFFTTKPAGKGTGLGLSLSRNIVREHGGRILVDSEPGTGTRVRIELPFGEADPSPAAPPGAGEPADARS